MSSSRSKNKEGDLFRQGGEVNVLNFAIGSNVPLLCLNHEHIVKFKGSKEVDKWFDDSISFGFNSGSVSFAEGMRTEKPNFQWNSKTLGYTTLFKSDTPFEDIPKFDVVSFMKHQNIKMYPEILDNQSFEDPYFLNGTIDVLKQKTILAGKVLFDFKEIGGKTASGIITSQEVIGQISKANSIGISPFEDIAKSVSSIVSSSLYTPQIAKALLEEEYVSNEEMKINPYNEFDANFVKFYNKTLEYRDSKIYSTLTNMSFTGSLGPIPTLNFSTSAGWVREGDKIADSIAFTELKR